jgi:hypothetical protein
VARDPAEDTSEAPTAEPGLSTAEAIAWLREVDGELFRTPANPTGREAWVAVVRVPAPMAQRRPMIVGLGKTFEEAASVAAAQWRTLLLQETLH